LKAHTRSASEHHPTQRRHTARSGATPRWRLQRAPVGFCRAAVHSRVDRGDDGGVGYRVCLIAIATIVERGPVGSSCAADVVRMHRMQRVGPSGASGVRPEREPAPTRRSRSQTVPCERLGDMT
jgi:hypothetical protein